jgi:hypothetical protein
VTAARAGADAGCATISERLGESPAGSAARQRRWLLLEQPGPWGDDELRESDLPLAVGEELERRADEHDVRVQLIQRTNARVRLDAHACFLASTERGNAWLARVDLPGAAAVLDLDLAALGGGEVPRGARPWPEPLYAVCTHARHDACCATRGRPLLRALRAHVGDRAWASSHLGGHRFAATFVAFPHGLSFGRVPAARGPEVVAAYERGELAAWALRGRAGDPWAIQAADCLVRLETGITGLDALRPVAVDELDADEARVTLATPDGDLRAHVRRTPTGTPRPTSCGSQAPSDPGRVELVELVRLRAADPAPGPAGASRRQPCGAS